MRTFSKTAIALGLAACLSASAQAQGPGGRGGMMGGMGGGANLLTNKSVQQELKLSEEQVEKVTKAATAIGEKMNEKRQGMQDLAQDERQAKMAEINKETTAEVKKTTEAIFSPAQAKRFEQIRLQAMSYNAFNDPDIAKKLNITADQKAKFGDLRQEMMSEMGELRQAMQNDREGAMKKMTELTKKTNEKAMAVLTSEQKASWKELTGEPFEIKPEPGMQGGNRRRQQ